MKEPIICCTVGMLLGDSWAAVPVIRDLCQTYDVSLVCGTYSLPAWEWAGANIAGCDWKIIRHVLDPDDHRSAFCPGFGTKGMNPALQFVRSEYPDARVLGYQEFGTGYSYSPKDHNVQLRVPRGGSNGHTVIHPYTAHSWKNCDLIVSRSEAYRNPVMAVGLPDEREHTRRSYISEFCVICESILTCRGFVGVLSAWSNFAALFSRPQIVVSFTPDVPLKFNAQATVLVKPSLEELAAEIERRGF